MCLFCLFVFLDLTDAAPLPMSSSPRATHTGPIKTGRLLQVLDHSRWAPHMKAAIDGLLIKHHGTKDLLKQVDAEYAVVVQTACTDPNSLLHPTTYQHISRYVKHVAKVKKHKLLSQHKHGEGSRNAAAVAEFDHRQPDGQCACHNLASCIF